MPGPPYATNPYAIAITHTTGSVFNVTSECLRLSYSRTLADPFTPLRADEAVFEFANEDGAFSPIVNSAIWFGNKITLQYTNVFSGNTVHEAFTGHITAVTINPQLGKRTTVIEALTDIDRMGRTFIDIPLQVNIPVCSLFTEVMTRTTVASHMSDLILDEVDFVSYNNANAVSILNQIIRSGYYTAHCDGAGTVRLRSRYYETQASAVATLEAMAELAYAVNGSSIINKMTATAAPAKQATDIATVAFISQPIFLPASGSAGFRLGFIDPRNLEPIAVGSIAAQVSGTDYHAAANSDGTGTNYTATLSVSLTMFGSFAVASIFNGASNDAFLSTFQLQGYPLLRGSPISVMYERTDSKSLYGLYETSFNDLLIKRHAFLENLAEAVVEDRLQPRPNVKLVLVNEQPLIWELEVGDIVSVVNDFAQISATWSVRSMRHSIDLSRGEEHVLECELRAPSNGPWLILDHATRGLMDADRVLAP